MAVKSGDGRKGPACSPVPQRSADGLLYELAAPCITAGPPFSLRYPPPPPVHAPSQRRDGWIGGLRTTIYMSPSAGADLSRQKKKSPTSPHDSSEAGRPFVICDSRLYEVTRVARSEGNHHPGDGKSNSANLWHISRNCHFLQSHKRGGELLALVSCVAFPCRLLQWNSPDSHRVSKSE